MAAPNVPDYAEALEQADAGIRLALPQFAERVGIGQAPAPTETPAEIDEATAALVGGDLLETRTSIMAAAEHLPLEGCVDLHLRFNALVNEVDRIGAVLAERRAS
jgi:hypothetical protein